MHTYNWIPNKAFTRSIEMMRKIILKSLDDSITIRFLLDQSKRTFDRRTHDQSKLEKTEFSAEFSSGCFESLKMFQVL